MKNRHSHSKKYISLLNNKTFLSTPDADNIVDFAIVDYSNSPLPVFVNLQEDRGYGPGYSLNDTYTGIARFILSGQNDMFIAKIPADIIQVTYVDTHSNPFSAALFDGSIVIAWQCNIAGVSKICAAKYGKNNNRIVVQQVISTGSGYQNFPKGTLLPDERLLFYWQGANSNAKAKAFFSNFTTSVDEINITPVGANGQVGTSAPIILNDGRSVLLFESLGQTGPIINGTAFDIDTQTRSDFRVSSSSAGYQLGPDGYALSDGGFVGVWHGYIPGNSFYNALMQRFDSNVNKIGSEMALTADSNGAQIFPFAGDQTFPKVSVNNGKICIVWECTLQGRNLADICLNVYDLDLSLVKTFTPLNDVTINDNRKPYITPLNIGGFRAVWRNYPQGSTANSIFTLLLDDNVTKVRSQSLVNTNPSALSNSVTLSASSLNGYGSIISWAGSGNIFYRKYNPSVVVDCGGGIDNISWVGSSQPCVINLQQNKGCGDDVIYNCENILCPDAGCTVTTNGGNAIFGGTGNNTVIVGALPVAFYGPNSLANTLSFAPLNTSITFNMITGQGTDGVNSIVASNVHSLIGPNSGSSIICSGGGAVVVRGGNGDDIFFVSSLPSFINGGSGSNTLSLQNATQAITLNFNSGAANSGTASDGTNTLSLSGIQAFVLSPNGDTFTGGNGNSIVYPGAGNDVISVGASSTGVVIVSYANATSGIICNLNTGACNGGSGRDILTSINQLNGSPYDDDLRGNPGNNRINGGNGNDRLTADTGIDFLTGGKGADVFSIENTPGAATITDFNSLEGDKIDLRGFLDVYSKSTLTINDVAGGDCVISFPNNPNRQATLEHVSASSLLDSDFIFTNTSAPTRAPVSAASDSWSGTAKVGTAFGIVAALSTIIGGTIYRVIMCKKAETCCWENKGAHDVEMIGADAGGHGEI